MRTTIIKNAEELRKIEEKRRKKGENWNGVGSSCWNDLKIEIWGFIVALCKSLRDNPLKHHSSSTKHI